MTNWFWQKINFLAGIAIIIILFGLIIFFCNIEIKDMDLWLHLASGKHILQNQAIPKVDFLSSTIAGKPWINHEWLFQVIIAILNDFFGMDGIVYMQMIIVLLTFGILLFLGYNSKQQLPQLFIVFLVIMVFQLRLTHRPDLFSLFFFVLYFYVLSNYLNSKKTLFYIFLIQILWVNIHGFFILGPLILFIALFAEFFKRRVKLPFEWNIIGRLDDYEYLMLKKLLVVSLIACLINPHFFYGALYPLRIFFSLSNESKIFFKYIVELQAPFNFRNFFIINDYVHYKILVILSFLSFISNYKKIDIGHLFLWMVFFLMSLKAVRNLAFFSLAAYFVFLANIQNFEFEKFIPEKLKDIKWKSIFGIVLKVLLILLALDVLKQHSFRGYYDFDNYIRKNEYDGGVSLRNFPKQAADFINKNQIKGNFINDFNSGAYLLGRCFPDVKVFIDGRTEVYGPKYFDDYQKIFKGDRELLNKYLEKYNLSAAFIGYMFSAPAGKIIRNFYDDKNWTLIYFDYDAVIFLKNIPENSNFIKKHKVELSNWNINKNDLLKFGMQKMTPFQNINRAIVLYEVGLMEPAEKEILEALRIDPYFPAAYKLLSKIYLKKKDYEKSFEYARKSKLGDPQDLEIRYLLGLNLYYLGDVEKAKDQCQLILYEYPKSSKGLLLLSLINIGEKQYGSAMSKVNSIKNDLTSDCADDLMRIADSFYSEKEYKKSREVYELVVEKDPYDEEANKKIQMLKGLLKE